MLLILTKIEAHFKYIPGSRIRQAVGQLAHQEDPSSTGLMDPLRRCRIGHCRRIKARSFIFYGKADKRSLFSSAERLTVREGSHLLPWQMALVTASVSAIQIEAC